jgi:hypothetical protein
MDHRRFILRTGRVSLEDFLRSVFFHSAASLGYHMATETEPIQLVAEIKELDLAKEGDGSKPKVNLMVGY